MSRGRGEYSRAPRVANYDAPEAAAQEQNKGVIAEIVPTDIMVL
jgi:hypothetical protein